MHTFRGAAPFQSRATAERVSQSLPPHEGRDPITEKRQEMPQSGRAVAVRPAEEFGKRRVGSLPDRAKCGDTEAEAAIGVPADDRAHAVNPVERALAVMTRFFLIMTV